METQKLLQVALRNKAIYIANAENNTYKNINKETAELIENLRKLGFGVSEDLLKALYFTSSQYKRKIFDYLQNVLGTNHNWTPLIKNWEIPTHETSEDHFITWIWNAFKQKSGTQLQCGHIIPDNTFPLERYNRYLSN